ncbi:MAG: TraB/GumN family protein [Euryarchaeota archaeon]|nr:TraB/GumN family protein [Euryarchaeota archaeon]
MLTIIGAGHVFDIKKAVREAILARSPAVVALELDPGRLYALQHPERRGRPPMMYGLLALTQQRLAGEYGTEAGGEMLAAADAAQECGAKVALIDRDAMAVFSELMRIPFKEKVQVAWAILMGTFVSKKTVEKEMARYQEAEEQYLDEFAKEFPSLMKVLVDDRNRIMADAMRGLVNEHGAVVAVVGDGHVPGITKHLADISPEVIRLKELQHPRADGASFSFTVSASPGSGTDLNP